MPACRANAAHALTSKPVDLQLQNLWIHDSAISPGLVNTNTTPMLPKLAASGKLDVDNFACSIGT